MAVADGVVTRPDCNELTRPAILSNFYHSTRKHGIDILVSSREVDAVVHHPFVIDGMIAHTEAGTDSDVLQGR